YGYRENNKYIVQAETDDVVLDLGGCWGDTALYFAHKVGANGKVYSFEFIPKNIELHNHNTSLNPHLSNRIKLVNKPVSNISGHPVYFFDNGPGSKISEVIFPGYTGKTETIAIDDFVAAQNLQRVDFIKMDIEGAELSALEGARNTIKRFRPKLAIAIYHSMEDFVGIPKWILDLSADYELYLG